MVAVDPGKVILEFKVYFCLKNLYSFGLISALIMFFVLLSWLKPLFFMHIKGCAWLL